MKQKTTVKIPTDGGKEVELSSEDGVNIGIVLPVRFSLTPPTVSITELREALIKLENLNEDHVH